MTGRTWLWIAVFGMFGLVLTTCAALTIGLAVIYSGGILPGVEVAGVSAGGLPQEAAAEKINTELQTILLRDADRTFRVQRESLGINLDTVATAAVAYAQGRGSGSILEAIFGVVNVSPVFVVDQSRMRESLARVAAEVNVAPTNAGVAWENGQVVARPAADGRMLDVDATLARATADGMSDGALTLVMQPIRPAITDATPIVTAAQQLLSNPLTVQVYDPVTGDLVDWSAMPQQWSNWITAVPDASSPIGLSIWVEADPLHDFLRERAAALDATRYVDYDDAVDTIQAAVARGDTTPTIRIRHRERQHVVQPGESITRIAWDYGIPYPYIQAANPGVSSLSAGQTITIPPADAFIEYEPNPAKRIIISLSQQRAWVYENGQIVWEWIVSTGIRDSPTWPGIYQVISHEPNAYAGNWNLYMPWFIGVYRPIPGSEFTNGFHGFPTRGGGQILWENSLGTRVTYGCILLSDTHVQLLYDWAELGVVVEIQA